MPESLSLITTVAAVAIGRNEGVRLQRCLTSLVQQVGRVIYVDSGSRDDSVAFARSLGVQVVELDMSRPFTAARARNAGFMALMADDPLPEYVQFVDGDCTVVDGWIAAGMAHLQAHPDLGLVTGWRAEIAPEQSVYNAMCDVEWHRPAGRITACGGDMIVRRTAFAAVEGFDPDVIAAEDDEFCLRLAQAGWKLERLPLSMTLHDANMNRFSEWWQRTVRAGHAFAQVSELHTGYFRNELRRVLIFGLVFPFMIVVGLFLIGLEAKLIGALILGVAFCGYLASWLRASKGLVREGLPARKAHHHAFYLSLSKFPNLIGVLKYHVRRARRHDMKIIEYK